MVVFQVSIVQKLVSIIRLQCWLKEVEHPLLYRFEKLFSNILRGLGFLCV